MEQKSILKNFIDWLKYLCLNFFHNGFARQGGRFGTLGAIFGIVAAYVLICGGLTVGYNSSFGKHYENASQFRQAAYTALSKENLSVHGGALSLSGKDSVVSFAEGEAYTFVIDTRPADTTYDDFTIICKSKDGKEITYDSFYNLSDKEKSDYSLSLKYSGQVLDVAKMQDKYRAFLDDVSDKSNARYNEAVAKTYSAIKEREQAGTLTGDKLNNEIYLLYVSAYYPKFGENITVPLLRQYYVNKINELKSDRYVVLFDDACYCSFYTDGGIYVSLSGTYATDGAVKGSEGIDELFKGVFNGSRSKNFLVFASDMIVSLVIFVVISLFAGMILAGVLKDRNLEYANSSAIFDIICGFSFVGGIIAFVMGVALPHAMSANSAYLAVRLIFLGCIVCRLAVLVIMDAVKNKKVAQPAENKLNFEIGDPFTAENSANTAESAPSTTDDHAPADPFDEITIEPAASPAEPETSVGEPETPDTENNK